MHNSHIAEINLKKHVRVHTGDKSYRYDTCGAKFSHSGTLKSKSHVSISTILNMELKLNDEKRKIAISVFCVCGMLKNKFNFEKIFQYYLLNKVYLFFIQHSS